MPASVRSIKAEDAPTEVSIKKFDDELRIVWGEVYAPSVPDSQGDIMSASEIRKMAHEAIKRGGVKVDVNHDGTATMSGIVESFIARKGDPDFIEGSWVVGMHVPDGRIWNMIKSGELNGFSFEGTGYRAKKTVDINVPEQITGSTTEASGHTHTFVVKYDEAGRFVGGETNEVNGHKHAIRAGTITEDAIGHSHRFSHVEGFHADHRG